VTILLPFTIEVDVEEDRTEPKLPPLEKDEKEDIPLPPPNPPKRPPNGSPPNNDDDIIEDPMKGDMAKGPRRDAKGS